MSAGADLPGNIVLVWGACWREGPAGRLGLFAGSPYDFVTKL